MQEEQNLLLQEEKEYTISYKRSLWWVEHRDLLRKIGYGFFIAFDGFLLLFVLWTMIDSFFIAYEEDTRQVAQMVANGQTDLRSYTSQNAAKPIFFEEAQVISIGDHRYDFYQQLTNPNTDWWAEFSYRFTFNAGATTLTNGFLLPGQSKPAFTLGVASASSVQDAEFELVNTTWHRIDHHVIENYVLWQEDRLALVISDATYLKETGFEKNEIGRTTFTVTNNTAYGYFDPEFIVLLKRGATVVGVNRATVASLNSGERQEISLNWFGTLPAVSSVEVIPDVHLFDPKVYQQIKGEAGIDTRTSIDAR